MPAAPWAGELLAEPDPVPVGGASCFRSRVGQQMSECCDPQEARRELTEKEKAAASCAFLHLPGEAPNAQSALARLP